MAADEIDDTEFYDGRELQEEVQTGVDDTGEHWMVCPSIQSYSLRATLTIAFTPSH